MRERLRRATRETETEIRKGEKMSASNEAAGVKCWRLPNVCVCVRASVRESLCTPCARARLSFAAKKKCPSVLACACVHVCMCACVCVCVCPPPPPPPCHSWFVGSALMWPVAKSARRPPTSPHLNLPWYSPLYSPNKWAIHPIRCCPPYSHTLLRYGFWCVSCFTTAALSSWLRRRSRGRNRGPPTEVS